MTDKLLCPFCNKPLQPTLRIEDEYFCENYDCSTSITWVGTSSLWKALSDTKKKLDNEKQHEKNMAEAIQHHLETEQRLAQECMKAEKKLDIAVDALIGIEEGVDNLYIAQVTAEDALEKIGQIN